jgi:putative holliday junction resolvase
MGRILAIDYGTKRVGLAVTDPLKIIATGLDTVHSKDVIEYLKKYISKEEVELFVVGHPKNLDNTSSKSYTFVQSFVALLKKNFPTIDIKMIDERFTSKIASQSMILSGLKQKDRQNKGLVDKISAVLILQTYLELK